MPTSIHMPDRIRLPQQPRFAEQSHPLDRRHLLRGVSALGLSTWLGTLVAAKATAAAGTDKPARFNRCITLWMQGGPSQLDTFDPKPGTETGGPLKAVSTKIPGLQFCETLPQLASRADDLCLIRSVGSDQGEHERASYLLHTGYERIDSFPRPGLGSYLSHAAGEPSAVPGFVTLGGQVYDAAFLGTPHGPFVIHDLQQTAAILERVKRRRDRLSLIGELNQRLSRRSSDPALSERAEQIQSVGRLLNSSFAKALDLDAETASTRQRYGESVFGNNVLVARRMLETGVRYVEVQMPGWDTHVGNFAAVRRLCQHLEPAWMALMDDLKSNGMWEDTLILWMGEFGRTPVINGQSGRDHYPASIPVTLAGKSLGGRVIGSTGITGQEHGEDPHSVADLMYTLMTLLGVDADRHYTTGFGSPTTATDGGSMIL